MAYTEKLLSLDHPSLFSFKEAGFSRAGLITGTESLHLQRRLEGGGLLAFLCTGTGTVGWQGQSRRVKARSMIAAPPGVGLRLELSGKRIDVVWLEIDETSQWQMTAGSPCRVHAAAGSPERLREMMAHLLFDSQCSTARRRRMAELGAEIVLHLVASRVAELTGSSREIARSRLEELWLHVRYNPTAAWRNADLARTCHCSVSHLIRQCRDAYGCSPQAMVRTIRITLAKELLMRSDLRIYQIAAQTGFSDAYSFSASFKRALGMSPRRFRREAR